MVADKEIREIVLRRLSGSDGFDPESIRIFRKPRTANGNERICLEFNIGWTHDLDNRNPRPVTGYYSHENHPLAYLAQELGTRGQVIIKGHPITPSIEHFIFEIYPPQDRPPWGTDTGSADSFVRRNESKTAYTIEFEPFVVRVKALMVPV